MVSIIVPVYNAEKTINRCIDSVLSQTFSDIELLLIDDGSSDSSAEICINYANIDSRVRYIRKENGGAASARNLGLKEAKGEYIQFVDSDDYISSDMTNMLYHSIVNNNSDLSICGMVSYTPYSHNEIIYQKSTSLSINNFVSWVCKYYDLGILHSCWNKLYKKSLIETQMNPQYRWGEDYIFNLQYLGNVKNISIVDEALYYYDCTNESVTRSKYQKQELYIKERYSLSLTYLDKIFHSKELNHIISYRYMRELFADYKYSNNIQSINCKSISTILENNDEAIDFMKSIDSFSDNIIKRNANAIVYKLRKEKIQFWFKNIIKSLIIRFRCNR